MPSKTNRWSDDMQHHKSSAHYSTRHARWALQNYNGFRLPFLVLREGGKNSQGTLDTVTWPSHSPPPPVHSVCSFFGGCVLSVAPVFVSMGLLLKTATGATRLFPNDAIIAQSKPRLRQVVPKTEAAPSMRIRLAFGVHGFSLADECA